MEQFKCDFVDFALEIGALKFGDFTLKSGRRSPFFFNAGSFNTGRSLARLCKFYARALIHQDLKVDTIFGPAYKGIPLAAGTVMEYSRLTGQDLAYSSMRKEEKDHGDKGIFLGHKIVASERVLILDDVVTSGISAQGSIDALRQTGCTIVGIEAALNRSEKGLDSDLSALAELSEKNDITGFAIVSLPEAVAYLRESRPDVLTAEQLRAIEQYFATYGATR